MPIFTAWVDLCTVPACLKSVVLACDLPQKVDKVRAIAVKSREWHQGEDYSSDIEKEINSVVLTVQSLLAVSSILVTRSMLTLLLVLFVYLMLEHPAPALFTILGRALSAVQHEDFLHMQEKITICMCSTGIPDYTLFRRADPSVSSYFQMC